MAIKSKGKGKSGGARVITFNILTDVKNGQVVFLLIYDKEDASTVKVEVVKQIVRDMGLSSEQPKFSIPHTAEASPPARFCLFYSQSRRMKLSSEHSEHSEYSDFLLTSNF